MKIVCNECNYSWEGRKKKTKSRRQCPKCYSYDLTEEGSAQSPELPPLPSLHNEITTEKHNNDIENDEEILALKKELRKAELEIKIREIREPIKIEKSRNEHKKAFFRLIGLVLAITEYPIEDVPCFFCEGVLEYHEWKENDQGFLKQDFICTNCMRIFPFIY